MDLNKNTLYRELIMEHYKNPQNAHLVPSLKKYSIKNPLCGDSVTVQLDIQNDVIVKVHQNSIGCSISTASTSMFSELLEGYHIFDAKKIINNYYKMVKGEPYDSSVQLGDTVAFSGIADYPARFKCATVALEAVLASIEEYEQNKK